MQTIGYHSFPYSYYILGMHIKNHTCIHIQILPRERSKSSTFSEKEIRDHLFPVPPFPHIPLKRNRFTRVGLTKSKTSVVDPPPPPYFETNFLF